MTNEDIIRLHQTTPDQDNFQQLNTCDLPVLVLGFFINNLYDYKRSTFKRGINYINISHKCLDDTVLIKGVVIEPNKIGKLFLNEVDTFPKPATFEKFSLTCNNNYMYHRNGLYIIDMNCINTISDYNIDPRKMLDINKDFPWFSYFIDFKLFCLTNII
jgi:hypothetical protein